MQKNKRKKVAFIDHCFSCCISHRWGKFGEVIVNATIVNTTYLECISPALPPSTPTTPDQLIWISNNNGVQWTVTAFAFHYHPVLRLDTLYPKLIPLNRSTTITISGANFVNTKYLQCTFDNYVTPARFINSSTVECNSSDQGERAQHVTFLQCILMSRMLTICFRKILTWV